MSNRKRVAALKLMLDDLKYPNRELRLMAQVDDCSEELTDICEWLMSEIAHELAIETMFDEVGGTEP